MNTSFLVSSVQLSDSTRHVSGMLDLLTENCLHELSADTTYQETDDGQALSEVICDQVCQPDCGLHGVCEHGLS